MTTAPPPAPRLPDPAWRTPFENDPARNTTATYAECVAFYQRLAAAYPAHVSLREAGPTDCGLPLHEVVLTADGDADPAHGRARHRPVLFVQNGIHPGEPEGIDASMMLARDLVQQPGCNSCWRASRSSSCPPTTSAGC